MYTKRDKKTNRATKTREKKLPESKKEYGRPNIKGIQYMFIESLFHIDIKPLIHIKVHFSLPHLNVIKLFVILIPISS